MCKCEVSDSCNKLDVTNWLEDVPLSAIVPDIAEVRFKNNRKLFYRNVNGLELKKGDVIAVESSPGHDIGIVSLIGDLVYEQMRKCNSDSQSQDIKKIYRKAKSTDIEKWAEAISLEEKTMISARKIAESLKLNMKIGDVEYQGDKTKAVFYYIADERVDFRELIKVLSSEFKVRIEMKQIGARQEAGRIGGIGACGRELCCATWISNFNSVSTNSARIQDISLNPQKLAGQCSKLKCCLNYELDVYIDARKGFPDNYDKIETIDGTLYLQKTDIFRQLLWYSKEQNNMTNVIAISLEQLKDILLKNKNGVKAEAFNNEEKEQTDNLDFTNVVGLESLTRFDNKKKNNNRKKKKNNRKF
ncbi:MAG: hypothetical protein A2X08_08365 [Bacteroidetes bacterium GWA2_32_17]|nr:MAG: hypothetical protein A2X08_08365 [Bacteroidetes bacterium GWA2_32_17]